MPTESAFIFAGLLFVAAALGYVFARLGQVEDDAPGPDYLRGLKFLLSEQPDRALDAISGAGELDEDTLETHFALGQLFRKRGEVDRAIRVHRDLIERPNIKRNRREQAQFELAQDYLSAGLFDRAEALLVALRDSPEYGVEVLGKLVRLSELTREWERAIDLQRELDRLDRPGRRHSAVGHYLCELAEQAREAGDRPRAMNWLERAEQVKPETVRSMLVRAAIAADVGDHGEAARCYRRVAEHEPSLLIEVLPRYAASCRATGRNEDFSRFLTGLLRQDPRAGRAVALAAMIDPEIADPLAVECLWDFVAADQTLKILVDGDRLRNAGGDERAQALTRLRGALRAMAAAGRSYRCIECGYSSPTLQWQCPGCAAWDTVRPRVRLAFDSGDR